MKTVHVITSLEAGGAQAMLARLLAAQGERGREAHVVSLTAGGAVEPRIRALGIPVTNLGLRPGRPDPAGMVRLLALLRRERPALVQTWLYHADLLGGLAARALRLPVIWGVRHGDLKAGDNRITRLTRAACARLSGSVPAAVVCNSAASIRIHVEAGYAPGKFVHIPNGFDLGRHRPDPAARAALRRELDIPPDAPVVGLVARFHPHKDHATFVRAADAILRRRPDARFLLCGEGIERANPALAALVDGTGRAGSFYLLGRREDVERVYASLDVACLSSVTESFPNVLGEAMACGVPCVTTDCGDVRELVEGTGQVVPVGDAAALADAVLGILSLDAGARQALGEAARARVRERYDVEVVARAFTRLQDEVVAGARR